MARQFKLRLRDGTILAVDQGGLRTWLIDDKAMVQPMGTRGWRPLKEILAEQSLAAAMKPPPGPPPSAPPTPTPSARRTLSDADIPSIPIKPPPTLEAPRTTDPVLDAPVEALVPDRIVEPAPSPRPPAPAPRAAASPAPVAAPPAPLSPGAGRGAAPPAPPSPRPDAPAAPPPARAAAPAQPAAPLARAASAPPPVAPPPAPTRAAAAPAPPAVSPAPARPPAPVPRAKASPPPRPAEPLIPEPPPEDAPVALDDLPIIPFKALEDEPTVPRVSVRVAEPDSQAETDLADELALVIQREVAQGHAVVIREEDLEELDLLEDDRDDASEKPPVSAVPPAARAAAAAMATGVNRFVAWSNAAMSAVRAKTNALRAARRATRPDPVAPPPPLASLPVVPLAADPGASASRRRLVRVAGVAAAALAVAVAAGIGISRWMDGAEQARVSAPPLAPPPPPEVTEPQLPPEVAAVVQRLPHLAPETVQVLIATSPFGNPDAPDVFRRARAAVRRGTATLPPEEAQELAVLERAVLVRLSPPERERVMAYDRLRAGRDLLPAEDARVLDLVARGARALPAEHRARLQALSAKAIAAALAPPPDAAGSSAAASR